MIIDKEFSGLLQSLSKQEYKILEKSIIDEGCTDPLVVWGDTLIDGHNRYSICTRHNIKFKVIKKEFSSREDALNWIDNNQLGRRNLSRDQYSLILGRMYNRHKKAHGARGEGKKTGHSDQSFSPADKIAKEHGTSERTVRRAGEVVESIEKLKDIEPDLEYTFVQGTAPSRNKINAAAAVVEKDPVAAKEILHPTPKPEAKPIVSDAIKSRGIGVQLAHEAIAILKKIPEDDALRIDGYSIVSRWIKLNK